MMLAAAAAAEEEEASLGTQEEEEKEEEGEGEGRGVVDSVHETRNIVKTTEGKMTLVVREKKTKKKQTNKKTQEDKKLRKPPHCVVTQNSQNDHENPHGKKNHSSVANVDAAITVDTHDTKTTHAARFQELDDIFEQFHEQKKRKREEACVEAQNAHEEGAPMNGAESRRAHNARSDSDGNLGSMRQDEWRDDGLGGIYNRDGWTGRKSKEGLKIFKTHLLMRQDERFEKRQKEKMKSGKCPFDCSCCFI